MRNLLLVVSLVISINAFCQETAHWRGENRDGKYSDTGLLKSWTEDGPELLWHYDQLGAGHSSATVTKDKIFMSGTSGINGFIVALDYEGKVFWKTEYGKEWFESWDGVRSTPMYHEGKIYIISGYGVLSCLNADGEIVWQIDAMNKYGARNIKWGITENLLIHEDKLFCTLGGEEHNVVAFNKDNGDLIWSSKGKGELGAYCSPIVFIHGGKVILATATEKSIMGLNVENGNLLWSYEFPNKWSVHSNAPLYHDGYLFHSCGYGKGCVKLKISEDATSITEEWTNEKFDGKMGGFILLNDKIYGSGDNSRKWHCIDWKTGKTLSETDEIKKGNVIYADGLLYLYGQDGVVALVEPEGDTYNFISKFKVPFGEKQHWAHLVIHDKKLYVRHGESLMVYDIEAK